jgi:hypothetical protein
MNLLLSDRSILLPCLARRLGLGAIVLVVCFVALGCLGQAQAQEQIRLISITNHWRYNQTGSDLSGQFQQPAFDDSSWPLGQALLGLETSTPYPYPFPILTPLTVGGGRITYYFRRHFTMPVNPGGAIITASNWLDDGAVFYLNGAEVSRVGLGAGAITASTLASNAMEGAVSVFTISPERLAKGDNVLAVELHQTAASSSDVVFGLSLTATLPPPGPVSISRQPTDRVVEEGEGTVFDVLLNGTPPFSFQWRRNDQPIPGATNQSYSIAVVSTNDAGTYSLFVSNELGETVSDGAQLIVTPRPFSFFTVTNVWRFLPPGGVPTAGWTELGYNDSVWSMAPALFYNENATLPAPKNTQLPLVANGQTVLSFYFRTHFTWVGGTSGARLTARMLCDDGAVIYLNGVEARRIGMPGGTIAANTLASRTVGDANVFETFTLPTTALVTGDNVMAVEVHQSAANSSDMVFGLALGTNYVIPRPDLIIYGPYTNPRLVTETFAPDNCEINECATPGTRRLLRFDTYTRNQGTADLILGDPIGNPLFRFDPCHGHYHFEAFADYRLFDLSGRLAAVGNKVGFCLEDLERFDPSGAATPAYDCTFQGIQRGWADIYNASLPCQYIDVTGVAEGEYVLELEIDPDNLLEESNETNNITRVPVTITAPCTAPPANDNFAGAQVIPYRTATVMGNTECATRQPSEPNHAGNGGGHSIWYRWTAPTSGTVIISTDGSGLDTLLAVYTGTTLNNLSVVASDDDAGEGVNSLVTFSATAGTTYWIAVDGFSGAIGNVALNINPSANDTLANCLTVAGASGSISGRNVFATRETGEPAHAGEAGGHSLWYCWTAPSTGPFTFDTRGTRFDTLLAIYQGTSVTALTPVAADDDSGPSLTSRVTFLASAGTTYRIVVDGKAATSGTFTLNWRPAIQLASPGRVADQFQFTINGAVGERYAIESSMDLTIWSLWMRATNNSGALLITDPGITTNQHRFFRVKTE